MSDNPDNVKPFEELLDHPQKEQLRKALEKIPVQIRNVEKAESIGIDMGNQKKELQDLQAKIEKLLGAMGG